MQYGCVSQLCVEGLAECVSFQEALSSGPLSSAAASWEFLRGLANAAFLMRLDRCSAMLMRLDCEALQRCGLAAWCFTDAARMREVGPYGGTGGRFERQ